MQPRPLYSFTLKHLQLLDGFCQGSETYVSGKCYLFTLYRFQPKGIFVASGKMEHFEIILD